MVHMFVFDDVQDLVNSKEIVAGNMNVASRMCKGKLRVGQCQAAPGITHITGIIASGNYFVDTPQKVEEVIRLTGADAVEMEGAAVAQVAARNNVPALVIRALSDNADTDYEVFKEFDISEYADTAARLAVDIVKRL